MFCCWHFWRRWWGIRRLVDKVMHTYIQEGGRKEGMEKKRKIRFLDLVVQSSEI